MNVKLRDRIYQLVRDTFLTVCVCVCACAEVQYVTFHDHCILYILMNLMYEGRHRHFCTVLKKP